MSGIQRKLKAMKVEEVVYFDKQARVDVQCIMTKLKRNNLGKWSATSLIGSDKVMFDGQCEGMPLIKVTRES